MPTDYFLVELRQGIRLAVPVERIVEAIACQRRQICPIPGVAPHLLGILNQRGRLLWVLELGALLGLRPTHSSNVPQTRLRLLAIAPPSPASRLRVGCVVQTLRGLVSLTPDQIQAPPARLDRHVRPFLVGITHIQGSLVAVLNVSATIDALQTPFPQALGGVR